MATKHSRFELIRVELDGAPIGNATIDQWTDDAGRTQWSARVLLEHTRPLADGILVGSTRDGRLLSGEVKIGQGQHGPRGAKTRLIELHGVTPLEEQAQVPED